MTARAKPKTRIRAGGRWYLSALTYEQVEAAVTEGRRVVLHVVTEKGEARAAIFNSHVSVWEELE